MHRSTLEVTKEAQLSKKGDCIVAVSADRAVNDLDPKFKEIISDKKAKITIAIKAGEIVETVKALGSSRLTLRHQTDMVVRKSNHVCDRTLAIRADKAACDLSRELVGKLRNPKQKVKITLTVEV